MVADELAAGVAALPRHWHAHYFAAVDSTQDEARAASRSGAPHRSIFVADYQRAGRGRQGRAWLATPGVALLLSIVFRDSAPTPIPWRWTSLASLALAEAIEHVLPALHPDQVAQRRAVERSQSRRRPGRNHLGRRAAGRHRRRGH